MAKSRFLKLAKNAIQLYEEQGSALLALNYIGKYVIRRGPAALVRIVNAPKTAPPQANRNELTIAILAAGGVGDLIVAARYLRDLYKSVGPFTFDVFYPQPAIAEWIFLSVPGVGQHFPDSTFATASPNYDIALFLSSFVQIRHQRFAHSPNTAPIAAALDNITASNVDLQPFIDNHPLMDGFLAQRLQFGNITRPISLHSMSATPYGGDRFPLRVSPSTLVKFDLAAVKYITVHNGFEVQNITSGFPSTKCYPHFNEVVPNLRREFADLRFIQLGSKTSQPIPTVDKNLISKTTLEEAAALINSAVCHLDNESGLVHIAACLGTPACVVYGPTSPDYFAYEDNLALRPTECGNCWWITKNWMDRCPRGFAQPVCTYKQDPANVVQVASQLIRRVMEKAA